MHQLLKLRMQEKVSAVNRCLCSNISDQGGGDTPFYSWTEAHFRERAIRADTSPTTITNWRLEISAGTLRSRGAAAQMMGADAAGQEIGCQCSACFHWQIRIFGPFGQRTVINGNIRPTQQCHSQGIETGGNAAATIGDHTLPIQRIDRIK